MIVDAHTDVLLELLVRAGEEPSFELVLRRGEGGVFKRYWLPRLIAGGVGVQICPLYGEGARRGDARERTLAQEAEFRRVVDENTECACPVRTRAELQDSRLRLVLSMEGVEPLEGDPAAFDEWYDVVYGRPVSPGTTPTSSPEGSTRRRPTARGNHQRELAQDPRRGASRLTVTCRYNADGRETAPMMLRCSSLSPHSSTAASHERSQDESMLVRYQAPATAKAAAAVSIRWRRQALASGAPPSCARMRRSQPISA